VFLRDAVIPSDYKPEPKLESYWAAERPHQLARIKIWREEGFTAPLEADPDDEDDLGDDTHDDEDTATDPDDDLAGVVQGRCDVVNLVISDQRPAQEQFHEADFLDDEPSGDEDWDGRDRAITSNGYTW